MPVSKERAKLLRSKAWKEIRKQVLERAGNKCEQCGRGHGELHWVQADGTWAVADLVTSNTTVPWRTKDGKPFVFVNGIEGNYRTVLTILTLSHWDHNPENDALSNLKALCQRCHLRHDRKQHARNGSATRARKRRRMEQLDLFSEER